MSKFLIRATEEVGRLEDFTIVATTTATIIDAPTPMAALQTWAHNLGAEKMKLESQLLWQSRLGVESTLISGTEEIATGSVTLTFKGPVYVFLRCELYVIP